MQRGAQLLEGVGTFPDQGVMGVGDDRDGLGLLVVFSGRAQLVSVDTNQVG